jgi:hypothetical protein
MDRASLRIRLARSGWNEVTLVISLKLLSPFGFTFTEQHVNVSRQLEIKLGASYGGRDEENRTRRLKRKNIPRRNLFNFSAHLTITGNVQRATVLIAPIARVEEITTHLLEGQYVRFCGNVTPIASGD